MGHFLAMLALAICVVVDAEQDGNDSPESCKREEALMRKVQESLASQTAEHRKLAFEFDLQQRQHKTELQRQKEHYENEKMALRNTLDKRLEDFTGEFKDRSAIKDPKEQSHFHRLKSPQGPSGKEESRRLKARGLATSILSQVTKV